MAKTHYQIGINTNCGCGDTLEETLRNIKAAGFRHIMLLPSKNGDLEQELELATRIGLKVAFVHLPHWLEVNNFWTVGRESDELINKVIEQIKVCDKYGARVAVIHSTKRSVESNLQLTPHGVNSFRKLLQATEKCSIKIAIENLHSSESKFMEFLFDKIKDERLGLCYDCGHHNLADPNTDWLGKYGDRCFAIHLHDNLMDLPKIGIRGHDLHMLPFDGKIDFEKVIRGIAKSKYRDIIMIESSRLESSFYQNISPTEFLREAKSRGEKLAKMLDAARKKISLKLLT